MNPDQLVKVSEYSWQLPQRGGMNVPATLYASEELIRDMDEKVAEQICNVARLPGIVAGAFAMPDAHWGYGFPIGGVAAFDDQTGVISAGGVGFDISCGVRLLTTGLTREQLRGREVELADLLYARIPVGVGSTGVVHLDQERLEALLVGGAPWAVAEGFGIAADLERTEEHGCMAGAKPEAVSDRAKERQRDQLGTLGSGNHYLEVQEVTRLFDAKAAEAFGLHEGQVVISLHCGSRGLGHQVGTDYLREMLIAAPSHGLSFPDRELACAPLSSPLGQRYLGAMRAAINCALANRQVITHLVREAVAELFLSARLDLLYDVSHNTCKVESHRVQGARRTLYVHRKGATRAFGPDHPALPVSFRAVGQPVLIGGSMGTASYVLVGTSSGEALAFSSACHGAGRAMSRHEASRKWSGRKIVDNLARRGIFIRSPSARGVAEEAPEAYKPIDLVVEVAERAGLANRVARLEPIVCVKG